MNDYIDQLLPEERLLLALCHPQCSESQNPEILSLVKLVTRWDRFVTLANKHGIIALCCYTLNDREYGEMVPGEWMGKMHQAYLKSLARNTQIYTLLDEVLSIASPENIKVVLLKGLALESTVYGNKGVRQMTDLDILVKREAAMKLRSLLFENGFESMPMYSKLHDRIVPSYGKHLPEMFKNGLSVEIHFRLFEDKSNSLTSDFFRKAVLPFTDHTEVLIPDPQFHFLYLVKHLAVHESEGYSQLRLYADLLNLLSDKESSILNESLFLLAKEAGLENALNDRLLLLSAFFGVERASDKISDPVRINQNKIVEKFIYFLRHPAETEEKQEQESLLKPLKMMERASDKVLFVLGSLFPSITFMKYRYKTNTKAGAIRYYPVRWAKMVRLILSGKV